MMPYAKPTFVALEVIAYQSAAPADQEVAGIFTSCALADVVNHGYGFLEGAWRLGPAVSPARRFLVGFEHLQRRLVGVHHETAGYCSLGRINPQMQPHGRCSASRRLLQWSGGRTVEPQGVVARLVDANGAAVA